jgi:hypothetical protein
MQDLVELRGEEDPLRRLRLRVARVRRDLQAAAVPADGLTSPRLLRLSRRVDAAVVDYMRQAQAGSEVRPGTRGR